MQVIFNSYDSSFFKLNIQTSVINTVVSLKDVLAAIPDKTNLITIVSSIEQNHLKKYSVGKLNEYHTSFINYCNKLERIRNRFPIVINQKISSCNLKKIYAYSSKTRYSSESKFDPQQVLNHKLKMISDYKIQGAFCSSFMENEILGGFNLSNLDLENKIFSPYELIIDPKLRLGFLAISLLKESANYFQNKYENWHEFQVKTYIYSENKNSTKLFEGLGFKYTNSKYYYNIWI